MWVAWRSIQKYFHELYLFFVMRNFVTLNLKGIIQHPYLLNCSMGMDRTMIWLSSEEAFALILNSMKFQPPYFLLLYSWTAYYWSWQFHRLNLYATLPYLDFMLAYLKAEMKMASIFSAKSLNSYSFVTISWSKAMMVKFQLSCCSKLQDWRFLSQMRWEIIFPIICFKHFS